MEMNNELLKEILDKINDIAIDVAVLKSNSKMNRGNIKYFITSFIAVGAMCVAIIF